MRLAPRACLCFFALLYRSCTHWSKVWGTLMGMVSPISTSQRDTLHRAATNWKEVSSLRYPEEQGTQSCFCLGQADTERSHKKQLVFPTGRHLWNQDYILPYREQTLLERPWKNWGTQVWARLTPCLPVARAAPKGESRDPGREQEDTRGDLTLVLTQAGYGEPALLFLLLVLRLRSHLILYWLCISHLKPQCRLLE